MLGLERGRGVGVIRVVGVMGRGGEQGCVYVVDQSMRVKQTAVR